MAKEGNDQVQFELLALRCQTGDPEAFEDLIAVMEKPLLYYATSLTGNQDAALDVLQDVWLKVVRSILGLKNPGSLKPWLYAITHGVAVDRIRRDYRRDKAEQAQVDDAFNIDEPSFGEEDSTAIRDALSRLGVKHREILVLHFLQDLSILEIANVVGCSEGTVKSRSHARRPALHRRTVVPGEIRFLMTTYANPLGRLAPRTSRQPCAPSMQNSFTTASTPSPKGSIAGGSCGCSPISIGNGHHAKPKRPSANHKTVFNLHNSCLYHRDRDACGFLLVS